MDMDMTHQGVPAQNGCESRYECLWMFVNVNHHGKEEQDKSNENIKETN